MNAPHEGLLVGKDLKFGIVISRFNEFITGKLLAGCQDTLLRHQVEAGNIDVFWVPGAFEIPLIAQKVAHLDKFDAIICLGAVIRGATPHFDYIAAEVSKGVASVGLATGKPVIFGVLTTDTIEQAIERAGTKMGNEGATAAAVAIEMANLIKNIATTLK